MEHPCIQASEVSLVCESVDIAQKQLAVLRALEATVSRLTWLADSLSPTVRYLHEIADELRTCKRTGLLDQDGSLSETLGSTGDRLRESLGLARNQRTTVLGIANLSRDDREAVVEAYDRLIDVLADVHDAADEVKFAIGEHDADLQPALEGPILKSSEEIDAFFDSLS